MVGLLVLGLALLPIIGAVKGQSYRGAYAGTALCLGALGWVLLMADLVPLGSACWVIAFGCLIGAAAWRKPAPRPPAAVSWFDPNHPRHTKANG